jgi:hypothetical protein
MAAHASQIPPSALRRRGFAHTYGQEWYVRAGCPGPLEELAERPVAERPVAERPVAERPVAALSAARTAAL